MKKSKKISKSLILPALTALAFGAVAAGTTYALFTSEAKSEVTVVSGKVLVEKTVSLTEGETLVDGEVTEIDASSGVLTFECGGTATIDENGNVVLSNIVAGDKVTVKVHAVNKSNVDIKYRALVTTSGDFGDIVSFEGKANGEAMKNSETGMFTKFATAEAGTTDLGDYELTFGIDKDTPVTDGSTRSGKVTIKIEAIQGNAKTEDETEYIKVNTTNGFVEAVNEAESGSTIEVAADVALEETVTINKDLNLVLDSNITAPAGQTALVVEEGNTLILEGTTATSAPSGRAKYAANVNLPTISTSGSSTAIVINGGVAHVKGVKVVSENYGAIAVQNGGELTIDGGEFIGVEYGAMAFDGSKLTINGGAFTATDNFVIGTNGTTGRGGNTIAINGGVFNGYIVSEGYIGCGVYVANSDTVKISGGTFNIENGCGVLTRSGNTTVADDVVFNFANTEGGPLEGGIGDKKTNIPVNARIVKDLSKETYPGGVPSVSGKGVVDVLKTDGKTFFVSTEEELKAAAADTTYATKYIYLESDIALTSRVNIITKDTVVYGNGATELAVNASDSSNRVFNLDGEDNATLEGGSFSLVGIDAKTVDTFHDGRGISTYMLSDFKITLDDASLAAKYPFGVGAGSDGVTIEARNLSSTGYSAFQIGTDDIHGPGKNVTASFENCELTSYNRYDASDWNSYGAIVIEKEAANAILSFKNCKIAANNEPTYNVQSFLNAKIDSTGSASFEGCTFTMNGTASSFESNYIVSSSAFTCSVK